MGAVDVLVVVVEEKSRPQIPRQDVAEGVETDDTVVGDALDQALQRHLAVVQGHLRDLARV